MRPVIIVFAKAPIAGRVKTRLAEALGSGGAAALHEAFVLDTIEKLLTLKDVAEIELHTDIETNVWRSTGIATRLQCGGDLGARMLHAAAAALEGGAAQVCIVGSDAPTLPVSHIAGLLDSPADVALGPCEDGGYYAIACRRTEPEMFDGVEWSSERAFGQTAMAARKCGLSVECGRAWFDADRPEELARLLREGNLPRHTGRWLNAWSAAQAVNASAE